MAMFVLVSGFSLVKNSPIVKQGDVTYFFESGKMQCLSEVNPEGDIFILLKSLDKNTKVNFSKIDTRNPKKPVLVAVMLVEEDTDLCASWTNMQEVSMVIDPKPVETITLSGKTIHKAGNITILSSN